MFACLYPCMPARVRACCLSEASTPCGVHASPPRRPPAPAIAASGRPASTCAAFNMRPASLLATPPAAPGPPPPPQATTDHASDIPRTAAELARHAGCTRCARWLERSVRWSSLHRACDNRDGVPALIALLRAGEDPHERSAAGETCTDICTLSDAAEGARPALGTPAAHALMCVRCVVLCVAILCGACVGRSRCGC